MKLAKEVKKKISGKPFDVRSMFTVSINIRKKPGDRKYDVYYWTKGGQKFDSRSKVINSLRETPEPRKRRKVDAS